MKAQAHRKPTSEERRRAWRNIAISCIIIGVAIMVAPMFGLQFRRAARVGAAAPYVGVLLVVFGGIVIVAAQASRTSSGKALIKRGAIGAGALVALLIGLSIIAPLISGRGRGSTTPPAGPSTTQQQPPIASSSRPTGPANRLHATGRSASDDPFIDTLRRQHGEDKVWVIHISDIEPRERFQLERNVRDALQAIDVTSGRRPFLHIITKRPDEALFVVSPIDDISALITTLGATERDINRSKREVRISG